MNLLVILVLTSLGTRATAFQECSDGLPIGRVTKITEVDGEPVQILRLGEHTWRAAEKGGTLCMGDQIRTRFQSRARVRYESPGINGRLDVTVGVNTRIRTTGGWGADLSAGPAILDIVHGVIRVSGKDDEPHMVSAGPTVCTFSGDRVLANWDPFKEEANVIVVDGSASCAFEDSFISVDRGQSLEVVRGRPGPPRRSVPLILKSFDRATR